MEQGAISLAKLGKYGFTDIKPPDFSRGAFGLDGVPTAPSGKHWPSGLEFGSQRFTGPFTHRELVFSNLGRGISSLPPLVALVAGRDQGNTGVRVLSFPESQRTLLGISRP